MIKILLVDIDNTLLDFDKCAKRAIELSCPENNLLFEERFYPAFLQINEYLWGEVEKKNLTKTELHVVRWNRIFKYLNIPADGKRFEASFRKYLNDTSEKVDGAEEFLRYLSGKYRIYGASNADLKQQQKRLSLSGLLRYFDGLFTSGEFEVEKPSRAFFNECFSRLGDVKKEEVALIGDSLSADIAGGKDFGITTCWFNGKKRPLSCIREGFEPDYIITTLKEAEKIF